MATFYMVMKKSLFTIILAIVGIFLILLPGVLPLPENSRLWKEIFNAGHISLFGLLALVILGLSKNILRSRLSSIKHYILAATIAIIAGGAVEIAQIGTARDADIFDFFRDIYGVAIFLVAFALLVSRLKYRFTFLALLLLAWLAGLYPAFTWLRAYDNRDRLFPVVCNFDNDWERKFLATREAEYDFTGAPNAWKNTQHGSVGEIIFHPAQYPGLDVGELYPDWRGYHTLKFDMFNPADTAISLALRIEDSHHDNSYNDRFNYAFTINPGGQTIEIPLMAIEHGPLRRKMDMASIRYLNIFAVDPSYEFTLYIDNIRLE